MVLFFFFDDDDEFGLLPWVKRTEDGFVIPFFFSFFSKDARYWACPFGQARVSRERGWNGYWDVGRGGERLLVAS